MIIAWCGATVMALTGLTMAFVEFDLPSYLYLVIYYAILSVPIIIFDGSGPAKTMTEIKPNVSSENILPAGVKRASRAPRKFSTSQYDAPKPAAKEEKVEKEESFVPVAVVKKDIMNGVTVYEIKWQGLSESQNSWLAVEQFEQAPLSEYKHLISSFEAAIAAAKPARRKSMAKDALPVCPPAQEPTQKPAARRASKVTASKSKVVAPDDNKENGAPAKPAPNAPSPQKTRSRSSSVVRKTATKVKVTEKSVKPVVVVAVKVEKTVDDLSPRRTRRSVAHKI